MRSNVWKSVVGLEIHAQISSASKLFSGAGTEFGSPVNTSVSLFDAAIPGTLPVLNRRCVEAGILTALALSCHINPVSLFDRKHYFYADLPAGYQITQQRKPLAHAGELSFQVFTPGVNCKPYTKMSRIQQLQLEQDSGKSLHDEKAHRSLVDLNRAGVSLMELVFEPDLKNGEEAAALVKELALILQRLGTCSCKMEEGALRVDANVSIHQEGEPFGTRTEVKNIGSVRGVALAIQHEIERQIKLLERGEVIGNETRAWDAVNRQTVSMRDKEEKQDYRYMPEPNLPPLCVLLEGQEATGDGFLVDVGTLKQRLPELPEETRQKLKSDYGLSAESTITLVNENVLLQYFWDVVGGGKSRNSRMVANILTMELLTLLNKNKMSLEDCHITAGQLGEVVDLLQAQSINLLTARKILNEVINNNPNSPTEIMKLNSWAQINNRVEIEKLCQDVLEKNPRLVEQFKAGKKKVLSALLGQVAKATEQRANMASVAQILQDQLSKT